MSTPTLEVSRIDSASSLEALNRSEIDIQIATAKKYPRVVGDCLDRIVALATTNQATAAECFYSLRRGKGEAENAIEGPSVRLAEIVAASWGNLRVASNIIGNDGKFITARGICHDLETNVAVASEVQRRITDRNGRTYNEDMQVVTGNAAGAIAFRNAVFKAVPKAVISGAIAYIKNYLTNSVADNFEDTKAQMLSYFAKNGVTKDMLLWYFDIEDEAQITPEIVAELRTTVNAIREKQASFDSLFIRPYNEAKQEAVKASKTASVADKISAALSAQNDLLDM